MVVEVELSPAVAFAEIAVRDVVLGAAVLFAAPKKLCPVLVLEAVVPPKPPKRLGFVVPVGAVVDVLAAAEVVEEVGGSLNRPLSDATVVVPAWLVEEDVIPLNSGCDVLAGLKESWLVEEEGG